MKLMVGLLVSLSLLLAACKKDDSPINPSPTPPGQQHDISWPSLANSPWPMGAHDPQGTGRSSIRGGPTGELMWSYTGRRVASAVVVDKDSTLYYQSVDSVLTYALYALRADGSLKWKAGIFRRSVGLHDNFSYPIISASGVIYVVSLDGNLYAINRDGTVKWTFTADAPIFSRALNIGLDGHLYLVSSVGTLYAINPDSTVQWSLQRPGGFYGGENGPQIVMSPDGQTLYVGAALEGLYAIAVDGTVRWYTPRVTNDYDFYAYRLVDVEGDIYAAHTDTMICFRSDGTVKWTFPGATYSRALTMDIEGNLYTAIYLKSPSSYRLISLSHDGTLRWNGPEWHDYDLALICDGDGSVFAFHGDPENTIFAVRNDGSLKWALQLPYSIDVHAPPAIGADGTIFAPSGGTAAGYMFGVVAVH